MVNIKLKRRCVWYMSSVNIKIIDFVFIYLRSINKMFIFLDVRFWGVKKLLKYFLLEF